MMVRLARRQITLSDDERCELEQLARQAGGECPRARRARIVLLLAARRTVKDICTELGCSAQTVKAWRRRYQARGLGGLQRSHPMP
jgi:transposase-like protein